MATTFNAFEALKASGELSSKVTTKKNKKSKAKAKAQAKIENEQNGVSTPIIKEDVVAAAPVVDAPIDEAQLLERQARQSEAGTSRTKLWKDWIAHAADTDKGPTFKKTFLGSRALELTLESCLTSPGSLTSQQEALLNQLLVTFLPSGDGFATQRLHSAIVTLSSLNLDAAPDVKSLATHSIHQLATWLKGKAPSDSSDAHNDVDAWLSRINDIDRSLLSKQGSLKSSGPTVGREHVSCAWQMLKLQEEKVDLLKPDSIPSGRSVAGAPAALIACLENLREAIGVHLQNDGFPKQDSGSPAYSFERQQMLSGYQREETVLKQQAAHIQAQIKQLESQLRLLRSEAAELAEKLIQVQNLQSATFAAAPTTQSSVQEMGLPLPSAHAALEAAESLTGLVDGSGDVSMQSQLLAVQQAQASAPVDYTGLARSYLAMNLALLGELPQKIDFCKQRIARAEKMIALSGSNTKIQETNRKQKEESEKQMADTLKWAADAMDATQTVVSNLRKRYPTLLRVAPAHQDVISSEMRAVEELANRINLQYILANESGHSNGDHAPATFGTGITPAAHAVAPPSFNSFNLGNTLGAPGPAVSVPFPGAAIAPIGPKQDPVTAPPTAPVAPPAKAGHTEWPVPAPQSNGAPARPVSTRTWGKVEAAAPPADQSLPTPAEAFREAEAAEGSRQGAGRRRRA